jgi:hypothetical protein
MRVSEESYLHWEKDQLKPRVSMYPAIHAFLGGDPLPPPATLPERLRRFRRAHGLSVDKAARLLGCDEATWAGWERGKRVQKAQLIDVERLAVEMDRQINNLPPCRGQARSPRDWLQYLVSLFAIEGTGD